MHTHTLFLGYNKYDEMVEAEYCRDTGIIRGFTGYDYIDRSQAYDDNNYISQCTWMHSTTIEGVEFKSGQHILELNITGPTKELQTKFDEAYRNEGVYCCECGVFHDTDQYMDVSYCFANDEVYCKGCVDVKDILVDVTEASGLFKAPDITDMDTDKLEEVETLFCDSSGFGSDTEAALTKDCAEIAVAALLENHGPLKAGLTGIGQFQVYVTLFKAA